MARKMTANAPASSKAAAKKPEKAAAGPQKASGGASRGTQPDRKVRVGVIGLGMGRGHLGCYRSSPDCEIVAICDLDPVRLASAAAEFSIPRTFSDHREMLALEELDAVSVALPNFLHEPVTLDAFAAGKHVLCEKPMSTTVVAAQRMLDASVSAKKKLMIHFNYRFGPQAQALKRYVDGGELGKIYFARTGWHRRKGIPGMGSWFTNKSLSGGGPLIDLGVHRIDLALWLMGNPEPVEVMGATFAEFGPRMAAEEGKTYTVEDLACGMVRFANGAALAVEVSWASFCEKREDMYTVLFGDRGGAEQRNTGEGYEQGLRIYRDSHGTMEDVSPKGLSAAPENPQAHFVRCIRSGEEPMCSGRHGLQIQKILNGLYDSASSGRAVRLDQTR